MSAETLSKPSTNGTGQQPPTTPAELGLPDEPVTAGPDDSPASHLRAKLDAQLRALLAYEPGTRSGTDPEDLHQMRVAVRRMRSVLKLSGELLGPAAEEVRAELRWLGVALGEVRDYDVLIGHLKTTIAAFDEHDQPAADRLLALFVADRGKAKRKLTRALGSARYTTLLQAIVQLSRQPDHEPASGQSTVAVQLDPAATVRKPYRKLGKALAALPKDPLDDELHALRIHGKRLRYAAELAAPAAKKKQAKELKTLVNAAKRLQDVLGDHQDAVVAADRMRAVPAQDPQIGFIAGRIAERELGRRAQARKEWPEAVAAVDAVAAKIVR